MHITLGMMILYTIGVFLTGICFGIYIERGKKRKVDMGNNN